MALLSSRDEANQDRDLMTVAYTRAQKESPEFLSVFEGVNQSVVVALSTFLVHAEPEPVITIYNFVMSTFTSPGAPPANTPAPPPPTQPDDDDTVHGAIVLPGPTPAQEPQQSTEKLSVKVKLDTFQGARYYWLF